MIIALARCDDTSFGQYAHSLLTSGQSVCCCRLSSKGGISKDLEPCALSSSAVIPSTASSEEQLERWSISQIPETSLRK